MIDKTFSTDTVIGHAGNHPEKNFGVVNPPVYHASTILFRTSPSGRTRRDRDSGSSASSATAASGTPTTFALEEALDDDRGRLSRRDRLPSGLAAITAPLQAFLKAGDHRPDGRSASTARRAISATAC